MSNQNNQGNQGQGQGNQGNQNNQGNQGQGQGNQNSQGQGSQGGQNEPKSKNKRALGRGINSLIPTIPEEKGDGNSESEIQFVDIGAIDPNPYQPRVEFDDEEIAGLADSIKNQGLLQPVVLRRIGGRYQIISGERRFRAFKYLKRSNVPCIIKVKITDREMLELALVENIQREQLNEIEKAIAYQRLINEFNYTHEELAKQVGKSRAVITNSLRLLNLPEEIQEMVRKNEISAGHARALLSLDTPEKQLEAARRIVEDKLTVRDIENFVQQGKKGGGEPSLPAKQEPFRQQPQDPDIVHVLEKLQYKFGTPVKLKETKGDKGRIEIEYFSVSDLTRILDLLNL